MLKNTDIITNTKSNEILVYYFTFWMIPALIGKIAGWTVANIALLVWLSLIHI